jgi:hypothetical protein
MNTNALTRQYPQLTGEERFKLILAADDRGDEAEADRLANAAKKLHLCCSDHLPYLEALNKLTVLVFTDVVEQAANHLEMLERLESASLWDDTFGKKRRSTGREDGPTRHDRLWESSLAQGFVLRIRMQGWKLFCERMGIAPLRVWKTLPGFERLQRALEMAELQSTSKRPFSCADAVRWANRRLPDGEPERTEADIITAARFADALDAAFRELVEWYGG